MGHSSHSLILFFSFQAVNAPADSKKKALLNDTPSANVYSQLQKLAQQNPTCKFKDTLPQKQLPINLFPLSFSRSESPEHHPGPNHNAQLGFFNLLIK